MSSKKDKNYPKYPRIFGIFKKRNVQCVYAGPPVESDKDKDGARVYAGPEPRKPIPQEKEPVPVCVYAGPEYFEELARKRREEEENAGKTKAEEAGAEEAEDVETSDEEAKEDDADECENQQ